ncbi:hypothetical protein WR25_14312 [Diploscapter pachys]|uniref:Uncharacterized protein n=1 Tax=Diploscapter pachys TaxID=2018661 RepID=A0A2A2KH87_9BILA|nr:hypothetical protein WR25_14312 [Diploscapter pachys]
MSSGKDDERVFGKHETFYLTDDEFWSDIKDPYIEKLAKMEPEEVYPSNNPGSTLPDGSINFECHCVGHLVASPCGYEFRQALNCQKTAKDDEMEEGKCADELMNFMECVMRTNCFKSNNDDEKDKDSKEPAKS